MLLIVSIAKSRWGNRAAIARRPPVLDETELLEPPQASLDRGDRANIEEKQLLQGEGHTLRLMVADLAYEMVILHRAEEIEVLLLECSEGAQLLKQVHRLIN